jgi:hypothetical protein
MARATPTAARLDTETAPPYRWGALAGLCVFVLYLATLAPTTAMWDTSEYIAAAKVLGLPHPPGNPLFVMLAHAWGLLPIPVSYAARINILAALGTSIASGCWFLLIVHVLARHGIEHLRRLVVAAAGTLLGATAFTVWNQSVVNEKVYTISIAFFGIITWLMVRWLVGRGRPRNDAKLVAVAFLLGAGYTIHPAGLLPGLGVVLAVGARDWRLFLRPRLVAAVLGAFLIGLTPFVFEPIRAAQNPAINEGSPTACPYGHLAVACTLSETTYVRLRDNVNRTQYQKPSVLDRQASYAAQVGMWWLYFRWQWLRDPHGAMPGVQLVLALVMLGLGLWGAVLHWRWDRATFWYWAPFVFTLTLLLIYYMNFKYGYSQSPELGESVPREVRDRDYFYLWSYSAWSVWVAFSIAWAWERWRTGSTLLALAIIPLVGNWSAASRRNDTATREWAVDLLNSVEPYGIIVTNGDNDTFPLWYAQDAEGVRRDVTVIIGTYLNTDWFVRQMLHAPVIAYDAAHGPAIYRDSTWRVPTHPVYRMSDAVADSIPDYIQIQQPQRFQAGTITGSVAPGYLSRDEILVLRLITDALPERPLYFSPGSPYPHRFGLDRYIAREGLVEHLLTAPVGDSTGLALDVPRSVALWNIYGGPRAIVRRGDWIDRASLPTPLDYSLLGLSLGDALQQQGDTVNARRVREQTIAVIHAARLETIFGLPAPQ